MPLATSAPEFASRHELYRPHVGNLEFSRRLYIQISNDLLERLHGSEFLRSREQADSMQRQLQELRELDSGWDSYDAVPPNDTAFQVIDKVLAAARTMRVDVTKLAPSADGGIGACFVRNDRYAHIEASNEGELVLVMFSEQEPADVTEINGEEGLLEALKRISEHIEP
jgi:hypothetical protein